MADPVITMGPAAGSRYTKRLDWKLESEIAKARTQMAGFYRRTRLRNPAMARLLRKRIRLTEQAVNRELHEMMMGG